MWANDLGVLADLKLSFTDHISMVIGKARAVLGFVKFIEPYITKLLYISLVRPILEYASFIIKFQTLERRRAVLGVCF